MLWGGLLASVASSAYDECMQYTVRGIPKSVDEALRRRARMEGKSLNEAAIEALAEGLGLGAEPVVRRDLSDIAGSWNRDAAVEAALGAQDEVDEGLWK
jgi:hypothetical protein